jgi:hypothetical protein
LALLLLASAQHPRARTRDQARPQAKPANPGGRSASQRYPPPGPTVQKLPPDAATPGPGCCGRRYGPAPARQRARQGTSKVKQTGVLRRPVTSAVPSCGARAGPALAVACVATGPLVLWAGALSRSSTGLSASVPPGRSALQGLAGWAWIVAIIGVRRVHRRPPAQDGYRRRRSARGPVAACRRYGNQAVLPFYLLHEPVIVAAAWFIVRWNAPVLAQCATLVAVSFAAPSPCMIWQSGDSVLPDPCWA